MDMIRGAHEKHQYVTSWDDNTLAMIDQDLPYVHIKLWWLGNRGSGVCSVLKWPYYDNFKVNIFNLGLY